MSVKKFLLVAVTTLVLFSGLALPCQAQNPLNRRGGLRWLGQGFSDGYHRHNPGHDTSYYNPYTAHNSTLVSRSPAYQAILAQQANQQPAQRFFSGVPFSVYAAPSQLSQGTHNLPGQQFQGSFAPSVGSGLTRAKDKKPDNAFKPDDDDNDFRSDAFDDDDMDKDDDGFGDDDMESMDDDSFGDDDMESMDDDGFGDEHMESMDKKEKAMDSVEPLESDSDDAKDADSNTLGSLSDLNDSLSLDFD